MKFDYQFERKDFEQYLKDSNKKYNYACLIIFTVFYFIACFDLITTHTLALVVSYVISILILFSILKLVSTIFIKFAVKRNDKVMEFAYGTYKIELTDTLIKEQVGDKHFELAYKDIYHITKNKKYFVIYPKNDKVMYLFIKKLFTKEDTYNKCIEMILSKYEASKENKKEVIVSPTLADEEATKKEETVKVTKKEETKKKTTSTKKTTKKPATKSTTKKKTTTKKAK